MGNKLANIITGSRLLIAPIIFLSIISGQLWTSILLYSVALLTDVLDGFVARVTKSASKTGAFYDAGADFMLVFSGALGLVLVKALSIWVLGLMILMFSKFIIMFGKPDSVYDRYGKRFGICSLFIVPVSLLSLNQIMPLMESLLIGLASGSLRDLFWVNYHSRFLNHSSNLMATTTLVTYNEVIGGKL